MQPTLEPSRHADMASELSKFIEDELAEKGVTADDSERLLGALRVEVRCW